MAVGEEKYFIQTYGCQANIKDSQTIASLLNSTGMSPTKDYKNADVIILNSCSVRKKAEDKLTGWGLKKKDFKKGAVVFVTGCMVGSAKGKRRRIAGSVLKDKMPWAHYFLAPNEEVLIPNILGKKVNPKKVVVDPRVGNSTKWAYVNISTGCDNFCSFCVVPYARGEEVSRSKKDIMEEIKNLVSNGHGNIMLTAQNVNSWGLDKKTKFKLRAGSRHKLPFADLLRDIHAIEGVEKISFISSNPFDFTDDLIKAMKLPKIDRYLHIAVQSGNNEILKKMNRRHTIEEFYALISEIKKIVPEMRFGTDIIVGFPTETKGQFMDTVELFEKVRFDVAYISMYSERSGTLAARKMKDDVPLDEKKRRHKYLTDVWKNSLK